MKRIKIISIAITLATLLLIAISCTGCTSRSSTVGIYTDTDGNTSFGYNNVQGTDVLIQIGNDLYYDATTKIVYFWNGYLGMVDCATTPSPYYAANGLPYRYNPTTQTFEEIEVNYE